jgi:hypothetical protein
MVFLFELLLTVSPSVRGGSIGTKKWLNCDETEVAQLS